MKIKRRAIALLLSMVMVLTFMPALAFAEGAEDQKLVEATNEIAKNEAAKTITTWTEHIKSISFTPRTYTGRFTYREGLDLQTLYYFEWDDATQSEVRYTYDGYGIWFANGDKIVATLDDGSKKTLVFDDDEWNWYVLEDEDFLSDDDSWPFFDHDQYTTPWTVGGDNYFWVVFGGYYDVDDNWVEATTSKTSTKATIEEVSPLEIAQDKAITELNSLYDAKYDSCRAAQKEELDRIWDNTYFAIWEAETVAEVDSAMASARAAIGAVKTDAQLKAEEAEAARQGTQVAGLPKVKISKPAAAKKKVTVKWKKLSKKDLKKGVTNIEVWVCPNSAFGPADTKIVTVGKKKASAKVKGLAKGTYFVKVRAIKNVGGVKQYTSWSKVKKVKVKK